MNRLIRAAKGNQIRKSQHKRIHVFLGVKTLKTHSHNPGRQSKLPARTQSATRAIASASNPVSGNLTQCLSGQSSKAPLASFYVSVLNASQNKMCPEGNEKWNQKDLKRKPQKRTDFPLSLARPSPLFHTTKTNKVGPGRFELPTFRYPRKIHVFWYEHGFDAYQSNAPARLSYGPKMKENTQWETWLL
jgi:hypothetical protein